MRAEGPEQPLPQWLPVVLSLGSHSKKNKFGIGGADSVSHSHARR